MIPILRSDLRVASITLSRSTAPVEMREMLAVQDWTQLLATYGAVVREWAVVSTCHRFELYVVAESGAIDSLCYQLQAAFPAVTTSVAKQGFASEQNPWIVRMDEEAAEHLCRVAAGLDSLVLGEAQIQGQVIATYTRGLENGTIGPVLSSLFRTAIRVGKRART
jgi:glutamyl-tRNA reductase